MAIPFALQLYTVRDYLEKDFLGTLKQVKAIGYDFVETAGFGGNTAAEARAIFETAGLTPVSAHVGYQDATEHPETVIETAHALGVSYVATGIFFPGGGTREDWTGAGKALDAGGAKMRKAGIQLCYHKPRPRIHHVRRRIRVRSHDGRANPANLQAQIDTYWVKDAGLDPVTLINQYAGRCPLLHIKDMTGAPRTPSLKSARGSSTGRPSSKRARPRGRSGTSSSRTCAPRMPSRAQSSAPNTCSRPGSTYFSEAYRGLAHPLPRPAFRRARGTRGAPGGSSSIMGSTRNARRKHETDSCRGGLSDSPGRMQSKPDLREGRQHQG